MASLLDFLQNPANTQMLLGTAAGLLGTQGNARQQLAGGLLGGLQGAQVGAQLQQARAAEEFRRYQIEALRRQEAKEQQTEQAYRGLFGGVTSFGDRPTPENAQAMQQQGPLAGLNPALRQFAAQVPASVGFPLIANALTPKAVEPKVVGNALVDPNTGKPIYEAPRDPKANFLSADGNVFRVGQDGNLSPVYRKQDAPKDVYETTEVNGVPVQRNRTTGRIEPLPQPRNEGESRAFEQAAKLRGEFVKSSGDFVQVRDAFDRIQASASQPSAAGDLALIFNYMKMLDPGSTVREGEFATAQNAAGIDDRTRNIYNKLMTGERLAPAQRSDFLGQAGNLYKAQEGSHAKRVSEYERLARQNMLRPEDVIIDLSRVAQQPSSAAPPPAAAIKKGHVEDGYEFLGGSPADPKSWRKVGAR